MVKPVEVTTRESVNGRLEALRRVRRKVETVGGSPLQGRRGERESMRKSPASVICRGFEGKGMEKSYPRIRLGLTASQSEGLWGAIRTQVKRGDFG